jgi:TetR/AcrR family transcriptional regulator, transcriptional repressor of bet genes
MTPAAAYGVLDGLFQQALLGHVAGDAGALPTLVEQVHGLMPLTLR